MVLELKDHLVPEEKVLWEGRPRPGLIFGATEAFAIPSGIFYLVFSLFLGFETAPKSNAPGFMIFLAFVAFLVGLYFTIGAALVSAYRRRHTLCAVTDQRVIMATDAWRRSIRSLPLVSLTDFSLSLRRDGRGTITFGQAGSSRRNPALPRFQEIDDAADVYELIRRAQQGAYGRDPNAVRRQGADAAAATPAGVRPLGLWLGVAFVAVIAIAGIFVFGHAPIVSLLPGTAKYYDQLGLRYDAIGQGLAFRDTSAERPRINGSEVLSFRGTIANATEHAIAIPMLRLVLFSGQALLQEKTFDPPGPQIGPHGTVSFTISLENPDPRATRFEVTFGPPARGRSLP